MIKINRAEKEARKILREYISEILTEHGYKVSDKWVGSKLVINLSSMHTTTLANVVGRPIGACELLLARGRLYVRTIGELPEYICDIADPNNAAKILCAIKKEHMALLRSRLTIGNQYTASLVSEIDKLKELDCDAAVVNKSYGTQS
jgi:hypothetical protein